MNTDSTLSSLQIGGHDIEDDQPRLNASSISSAYDQEPTPNSPPPSFRSRNSSIASHQHRQPLISDTDRTLADTFESPSDDEPDDERHTRLDDRQRVMSGRPVTESADEDALVPLSGRPAVERRVTHLPVFAPATSATVRRYGGNNTVNDGVFANLSAKPQRGGEDVDEKPPVSMIIFHKSYHRILTRHTNRPTNKPPPTQHLPTGKPPSSPPAATTRTTSSSTASPSAASSPLFGTA